MTVPAEPPAGAACGCAAHADRSVDRPPSDGLKPFFEEGDSLYDATHYLCLVCETIWSEIDDAIANTHTWDRARFEGFLDPSGWRMGLDDAWPGDEVMASREGFVTWVRGLQRPVWAHGMV